MCYDLTWNRTHNLFWCMGWPALKPTEPSRWGQKSLFSPKRTGILKWLQESCFLPGFKNQSLCKDKIEKSHSQRGSGEGFSENAAVQMWLTRLRKLFKRKNAVGEGEAKYSRYIKSWVKVACALFGKLKGVLHGWSRTGERRRALDDAGEGDRSRAFITLDHRALHTCKSSGETGSYNLCYNQEPQLEMKFKVVCGWTRTWAQASFPPPSFYSVCYFYVTVSLTDGQQATKYLL